jgi:hypothetical protein
MLYQFLVLMGNWQFFCCDGKFSLRPEKKKIQSSVWRVRDQLKPEKKIQSSVCWMPGSGNYDRKKKIQSSVWRVVLYVVSVFGSDGKLAVFLL